jgi:hypothetical protein
LRNVVQTVVKLRVCTFTARTRVVFQLITHGFEIQLYLREHAGYESGAVGDSGSWTGGGEEEVCCEEVCEGKRETEGWATRREANVSKA